MIIYPQKVSPLEARFYFSVTAEGDKIYRSVIVGGRALTPPTRHSLGGPLPHQLADRA